MEQAENLDENAGLLDVQKTNAINPYQSFIRFMARNIVPKNISLCLAFNKEIFQNHFVLF